jgi:C1A family cysteine protease
MVMGRGLGWNAQRPDHRDILFMPDNKAVASHDLVAFNKIPYINQLQQGSCTAHGTAVAVMYDQAMQGLPITVPSRSMLYYDARIPEGTTGSDSGAQVRDAVAGVVKYGVCTDAEMPYNDQVCDVAPTATQYAEASQQKEIQYQAVRYGSVRLAIASGFPVLFGFTVYNNFYNIDSTGIMAMPEGQVVGGHCTILRSFNDNIHGLVCPPRHFRVRNSWGQDWAFGGDFFMPYEYWDKGLCSDAWVLKRIS